MHYFTESILDEMLANAVVVIFDMNGLIVDDEAIQLAATNMVLQQYNIAVSERYWIQECVGHKAGEFLPRIMQEHKIETTKHSILEMINEKDKNYQRLVEKQLTTLVRPGILELIEYIFKNASQSLAISTSASTEEVSIILDGLQISSKFDLIICGDEVQNGKPHPEIYVSVSDKMHVKPADCLVFEDTSIGIQSAANAGMICCAVPNQYTQNQDFSNAHVVLDNVTPHAKILSNNINPS